MVLVRTPAGVYRLVSLKRADRLEAAGLAARYPGPSQVWPSCR